MTKSRTPIYILVASRSNRWWQLKTRVSMNNENRVRQLIIHFAVLSGGIQEYYLKREPEHCVTCFEDFGPHQHGMRSWTANHQQIPASSLWCRCDKRRLGKWSIARSTADQYSFLTRKWQEMERNLANILVKLQKLKKEGKVVLFYILQVLYTVMLGAVTVPWIWTWHWTLSCTELCQCKSYLALSALLPSNLAPR
jgi:hypothetical protein